ncbi:MAG TPA: DUF4897 domain-containing protein [Thermotogota bacterium]|nr:DUF4897 domain-containing protein [Thermotogota bacterium]HRW92488.1 DUF4897 domain-containing protein [Thermotogota bacterium]
MNRKNWIWILLIFVVGFSAFNLISAFRNKPQYQQLEFSAVYTFGLERPVEMDNKVRFAYEKTDQLQEAYEYFNTRTTEEKWKSYEDILTQLSEKLPEPVKLLEYASTATMQGVELSIHERAVVEGLTAQQGAVWVSGFGENKLQLQENSRLVFVFPEEVAILDVQPQPDRAEGNVLTWDTPGSLDFPVVRYQ